jgi:hypothetical protein
LIDFHYQFSKRLLILFTIILASSIRPNCSHKSSPPSCNSRSDKPLLVLCHLFILAYDSRLL